MINPSTLKYWVVIGTFSLFVLTALIPSNVDAEEGTVNIELGETKTVSLGSLIKGDLLDYSWNIEDFAFMDFHFSDGDNSYGSAFSSAHSGIFEIPHDGQYSMVWELPPQPWSTVNSTTIYYSYSITHFTEIEVTYNFTKNPCPQSEVTSVILEIVNPNDYPIGLDSVQFTIEWENEEEEVHYDEYVQKHNVQIEPSKSYTSTINYRVEASTTPGAYIYQIDIDFFLSSEDDRYDKTWVSGEKTDFRVTKYDSDGDGTPDDEDAFPFNPTEQLDTDGDGIGDTADVFPTDANETRDTDGDGVGDNADAFPLDPAASMDTDNDGAPDRWNPGKNESDSTANLRLDAYPDDPERWTPAKKRSNNSPGFEILAAVGAVTACIVFFRYRKYIRG